MKKSRGIRTPPPPPGKGVGAPENSSRAFLECRPFSLKNLQGRWRGILKEKLPHVLPPCSSVKFTFKMQISILDQQSPVYEKTSSHILWPVPSLRLPFSCRRCHILTHYINEKSL